MTEKSQQESARRAAESADLDIHTLWLHYFSIGGSLEALELDAYFHGLYSLSHAERNMVALALNELIDELPPRPRAEFVEEQLPDKLAHL